MKNTLLILMFLSGGILQAQRNFQPGQVITPTDTLEGFIDFQEWEFGPYTITFKETPDGTERVFHPGEVTAFTVDDEIYWGGKLFVNKEPLYLKDLPPYPQISLKQDSSFLKVLLYSSNGVSLIYYKDRQGTKHFFIVDHANYQELLELSFIDYAAQELVTYFVFQEQLRLLATECPDYHVNTQHVRFSAKSITNAILEYNLCKGNEIDYIDKEDAQDQFLGIGAGGGLSQVTYLTGDGIAHYNNVDYKYGFSKSAGIFYLLDLAGNTQKLWFYSEIFLQQFHCSGSYEEDLNMTHVSTRVEMDITNIKGDIGIQAQLTHPHWSPYIRAGITPCFNLINNNSEHAETENIYTGTLTVKDTSEIILKDYHTGLSGAAGININNTLMLDFKYEKGISLSTDPHVLSYDDNFYVTLRYLFHKSSR